MTRLVALVLPLALALPDRAAAQRPALNPHPFAVTLAGARSEQQLVVTWNGGPGLLRDQTRHATYTSLQPRVAAVSPTGLVTPRGNGSTVIVIRADDLEASVPVTVSGMDRPDPVAFDTQVIPLLTRAGCNSGACH